MAACLWSPRGIDHEGFTFKALIGGGTYRYISGALGGAEVQGQQVIGFALPGWRFRSGSTILTTFAGLDVQHHRLRPDDPGSKLRGTQAGFRVAVELWSEPTPTTMLAADASVIDGRSELFGARRLRLEVVSTASMPAPRCRRFSGDDAYQQWRVGLHVTGLKTCRLRMVGRHGLCRRFRRPRQDFMAASACSIAPDASIQRPPEPRHRDRHRDQHQDRERDRVVMQVGEGRALQHDRAHDAEIMRERQRIRRSIAPRPACRRTGT